MKFLITLLYSCLAFGSIQTVALAKLRYDSIFNFGDSLSDAGNLLLSGPSKFPDIGKLPYGRTFFHHATGRCSDGRLIIDFIAEASGLPYLTPFRAIGKEKYSNFKKGVNFAVAGATALDAKAFYVKNAGQLLWTNDSLSVQLGWFKKAKPLLCSNKQECQTLFKTTLFLVGEIGGNDYNYLFFAGATIQQMKDFVPYVVGAITKAVAAVIEEGAAELMVPGNLPIGCSALYLTLFGSSNKTDYDENGCLKAYNDFACYHNRILQASLQALRKKYPHVRIIYADYYSAAITLFHAPKHNGFSNGALKACCGGGGPYNFNSSVTCGEIGSKDCRDPSTYANWDGIHLTEAAYRFISVGLISGKHTKPPLRTTPL